MLRATKNIMLPTTITGSLPRPSWYTQNLGSRSFLDAMVNNRFREQYVDAVSIYLHEQEMAGLDIVTDGDAHFDSRRRRPELDQLSAPPYGRIRSPPAADSAPVKADLDFRPATFCMTIWNHVSCPVSAGRSREVNCNTPRCSRWRSG